MRVQLEQIFLALAGRRVLSGLDLTTEPNEYVVILGASGSGKTTTLRVIAGLQRPDRGEIRFDRRPVHRLPPRQRGVSMVFQQDGLYPHLTIAQSIRLGMTEKLPREQLRERISCAATLAKIPSLLDRYPDQLSGGELRRAAVAKAIARQSPIRLLDEPLSALDGWTRQSLQDDLRDWHREIPGTTIHVTHDGNEAMRLADRIAVLHGGRIVQFATPENVYRRPLHVSAALAIGSPAINLIPARLVQGRLVFKSSRVRSLLEREHAPSSPDHETDRDVLVGIRPEALRVDRQSSGSIVDDDPNAIEVEAALIEIRQEIEHRYGRAELDGMGIHGLIEPADFPVSIRSGESLHLRARGSQLHLFDAVSGERLQDYDDRTLPTRAN
jgi:ABC-type sugar transport system ATPase subunit